jgi:hypothetical protein
MRTFFSEPPRWLSSVYVGVLGGTGTGFFVKTDGVSWTASGVIAAIAAIVSAAATWWWFEPRWRRERAQVEGDLPAEKLGLARRAAERGPVPTDPEIRAAALRIASHNLTRSSQHPGPRLSTALGVVMAIATVGAALSGSLWAFLYAPTAAVVLYSGLYHPKQLRRRIELLSAPADTPADQNHP